MEEKDKARIFELNNDVGRMDAKKFREIFWPINPKGDKATKDISDLFNHTWETLKFECATATTPEGTPMGAGYMLRKYQEYSLFVDDLNRHREQKYHSEKMSIYTFLHNKKYTEDFKPKNTSRTYYLYGNDLSLCQKINDLFIVESVKNRDGSDMDDDSIIRYLADLNYNIFTVIENGKS